MKRMIVNLIALAVILIGSLALTTNSQASSQMMINKEVETKCGACSTTDPDKCCKRKLFKRCEIYPCHE